MIALTAEFLSNKYLCWRKGREEKESPRSFRFYQIQRVVYPAPSLPLCIILSRKVNGDVFLFGSTPSGLINRVDLLSESRIYLGSP